MTDVAHATREGIAFSGGPTLPPPPVRGSIRYDRYRVPTRPAPERFAPGLPEAVLAGCLLVLGFLCWDWLVPFAALGACLFYLGALAAVFGYFAWTGVRQDARSLVLLAFAVGGALRFALMDVRGIDLFAHAVQIGVCLLWVAASCRTASLRWDGFLAATGLHQVFGVPLANLGRWFQSVGWALKSRTRAKAIILPIVGVVVCVPVFFVVMSLLAASDDSFDRFLRDSLYWLWSLDILDNLSRYLAELIFAVPVAAYIFGSVIGNKHRLRVDTAVRPTAAAAIARAHVLNRALLYGPLGVLAAIYLAYFLVMGTYLFSAMSGALPGGFSYAQYARQGFFELCGVATINLCALAVAYLLARREPKEYPRGLRALCATLSAFTCLLIVTAMSKLALYIGTFGLSQLRLYAAWFLVLLLGVFVSLVVWHLRPFDAGRPIAWIVTAMAALICVANTDGIIADYNVQRYYEGHRSVDVATLAFLNDAAVPALADLAANAPDPRVRADAAAALAMRTDGDDTFADWNLQSAMASHARG